MAKVNLPVDSRRAWWRAPDGRRANFVPNGKLIVPNRSRVLKPNWRSGAGTWSARLFVGFNVGDEPTYEMKDLIKIVRRVLVAQGEPEDSSYVYQRGVYTHSGPGQEVVEEDGAQVIILSLSGETDQEFEQRMIELANVIVDEMQQESVIIQMQEDGIVRRTIGVSETDREMDVAIASNRRGPYRRVSA